MYTRTAVSLSLALVGIPYVAIARAEVTQLCDVGCVRQLFIDDFVIDRIIGGHRVLNQPVRHSANPIIRPEHPWEGNGLQAPIVMWDDDRKLFHMYYWAQYDKDDRIFTCYATSADGLHWDKPVLNLHEGPDGTKRNNIVLRGEGRQARMRYVALNPNAKDRTERYVAMYIDNVPGLTEFAATSPDGIHWTTVAKIGDLRGVTGGPPTSNPRYFLIEQKWDDSKHDHRYRAIWRTESDDLKTWTGGAWAVQLHPEDSRDLEFYHATSHFLGCQTYHGLHLGYLYPYRTDPKGQKLQGGVRMAGTIDVELMASRDTIRWSRVDRGKSFFPLGPKGSWEAGMVFLMPEVVHQDRLLFYYGGFSHEHSAEKNRCAIGLATLRLDGFMHIEPKDGEATVVTKPFRLAGDRLDINADARNGSVRVALHDGDGKEVPGFDARQCKPVRDDGLRQTVQWSSGKSLRDLKGQVVRLSLHLKGSARLYAFQFLSDERQ